MKFKIITLLFIFATTFLSNNIFAQTQAEIEQMVSGNNEKPKETKKKAKKEKPVKLKAELNKKEKALKAQEKLAKEEQKEEQKETKEIVAEEDKSTKSVEKKTKNAKPKTEKVAKVKKEKKVKTKTLAEKDAEKPVKMSYNKLRKTGEKLGNQGSYYNALDFYDQALTKAKNDKKKVAMNAQLGDANYTLRDYQAAEMYYQNAIALNTKPQKYPLLNLKLANTYKALGKYDSAVLLYQTFIDENQENSSMINDLRKAKTELKGSNFALAYQNDEPKFRIKNAGENVNGPFTDYGPEIVDGRLYFSKINVDQVVVLDEEIQDKEFSKIYYAEINKDTLDVFQDFVENVNESKVHVGNPSFSADGNTLYFTKCTLTKEMQSECAIYKSVRKNNEWLAAEKLNDDINLNNSSNTQPQIVETTNGQTLYFVSNRTGGKGGKDIWYTTINKEGEFSPVKNIDYPINTAYDEVSPYFNEDNLYFSSNGHPSFGGLDVFKATKNEEGEWKDYIENLGQPVNSSLDDYDFVLDNTENAGYLASNRIGTTTLKSETCCDDIFAINPSKFDLFVKGQVFVENETKRSVLETADLYLYDNKTNERLAEIEYKDGKAFVSEIVPEMEYKIVAMADGFKDAEITFNTSGISAADTLAYNLFMKNKDLTGHVLATVYYEFDVSKLRSDAPDSLRKVIAFLEAYPDVIVEVGSHTDSKGSEEYNLKLSERRSLSVKNYLIYQKEVSEDRLINKWYGESIPKAPNTLENGKDNPAGRDLNRRTEFKVVGYLNEE